MSELSILDLINIWAKARTQVSIKQNSCCDFVARYVPSFHMEAMWQLVQLDNLNHTSTCNNALKQT